MIGVSAERGIVWLELGRTPHKHFVLKPDAADKLADAMDEARTAAELQEPKDVLGQEWGWNIRSYEGKVILVWDQAAARIPIPPSEARGIAMQIRARAGQARHQLELMVRRN